MEKRIDVFEELARIRKEAVHYKAKAEQWQQRCAELEKELKEVKTLLNQFLNANTPSSQLPPQFKPSFTTRPEKGSKPRGKPEGSPGATRAYPKRIDRRIPVKVPRQCTQCKRRLVIASSFRIVYEIPYVTVTVTQFEIEEGHCRHCNLLYRGTHPELPREGMMGPNLQAFFTELKHNFAGSYQRIAGFFEDLTGVSFSPPAINDCIERVADQLAPSYNRMEEKLAKAGYVQSDESSWPVNGQQWWLWLFATAQFVFLAIQKSRARRVLTNLLGDWYPGVVVSDCFRAYGSFAGAFQKDWVHLLRKTHFETEQHPQQDIAKLHDLLTALYRELEAFGATSQSFEERVWQSIRYHQKLQRIAQYAWQSAPAQQIVTHWLKAYEGQWLVPILMPEIPLTNNRCERGIRSVIPSRKLLGGHRTENGAGNFAIIETHRQTWKHRKQSPYKKLAVYLKKQNVKAAV